MKRAAGAASVAVVAGAAAAVHLLGVPEPSYSDPLWYLIVVAGLAYWVGMIYWSR